MSSIAAQPILALVGPSVTANPTQYMMQQALLHHQLDWRYLSLEVAPEVLPDAVRGLRALGFRGGNCVGPLRDAIIHYLDYSTPAAELSRVVNCFYRDGQALVGDNTEGRGFVAALRRRIDPAGKRILLLGAGRMARAIAVELESAHIGQLTILNRHPQQGQALADLAVHKLGLPCQHVAWSDPYTVPPGTDVVIDATPIGPEGPDAPMPLVLQKLGAETIVADVHFDPARSWLLREAATAGCGTLAGLDVFVEQAALSFQRWTGIDPDRAILREAVEEFLEL